MRRIVFSSVLFVLGANSSAATPLPPSIHLPPVLLANIPFTVTVTNLPPQRDVILTFLQGSREVKGTAKTDGEGRAAFKGLSLPSMGLWSFRLTVNGTVVAEGTVRVIPAPLSLFPPLLAIVLSLLTRQIFLALFVGIWVGATLRWLNPAEAFLRTVDSYLIPVLSETDHLTVLFFTLLLGGMVGIIAKSGGMVGLVTLLSRFVRSDRSAQFVTWVMGLCLFFDDYANALFVGTTMRPLSDHFRVSREKLSYLVDTTCAPIASLAFISTWVGFEVSLIGDAFKRIGLDRDPYLTFLASIPYRFYPLMALSLPLWLIFLRRDLGSMYAAETRARKTGKVLSETATPLTRYEAADLLPSTPFSPHWSVAVFPVLTVIVAVALGLFATGYLRLQGAMAEKMPTGWALIRSVLAEADSFRSLLWGSMVGCLVAGLIAIWRRHLSLSGVIEAWLSGMRTMFLAAVILTLAWGIGRICSDLQTPNYLAHFLARHLDPRWLPLLTSLVSAGISFATGSSWATMSLLMPLVIPLVMTQTPPLPSSQQDFLLIATISSVLAGSIFGDHCSPISDTTILSSVFSGADHIDHVRTQLPYASLAALVAWSFGDFATAYGLPLWLALPLSFLSLGAIVWKWGRPVPEVSLP